MVRMLSIYLEYYTHGDDRLWLLLKNGEEPMAMQTTDGHDWQCDIETTGKAQDFRFEVRRADGVRVVDRETPGFWHKWQAVDGKRQEKMLCRWHTFDGNAYWYSQAYKDTYCPWHGERTDWNRRTDRVIVVNCPGIPQDEDLIITGNQVELGNWQPEKGVLMRQTDSYTYVVGLETAAWKKPTEYKFVLRQRQTGKVVWEDGENRHLDASAGKRCWQEVKPPRMALQSGNVAGVAVPLFALRSEKSWGVGDFGDLKMLIDWASAVGMRAVQLLPVNDTTRTGSWEDSYPYNGISVYALHPMYADLSQLPPLKDSQEHEAMMRERERLQALRQVDYEAVNRLKKKWLAEAYRDYGQEEGRQSEDYKQFVKENGHWLWPYCYFCVLQEAKGTADFRTWGPLAHYDEMTLARWVRDEHLQERVNYFSWVQFVLDGQMKAVHRYAQAKGVMLKGDMPIGVSRDSATAWFYNDYFHFDGQAGAPPDYFSEKGQNWGFPTYNWERILADGGCWWQLRLQKMAEYFDAFRIDHVLGFFRIWEIPYDASDGRLGHFAPALPMTEEEIHRWGWSKPVSPMTVAAFTTEDLEELLHEKAPQLRRLCFRKGTDGLWHFKKTCSTQRDLQIFLKDKGLSREIQDALSAMLTQVLFVADPQGRGYYPAVSGYATLAYRKLDEANRHAFDEIHRHFFYFRHNDFWAQEAMKRLPCVVESTRMLVCAEDLGMVPPCVYGVLDHFKILSLEVQSMPKRNEGEFSRVEHNPHLSVDTITTHDMEPLRLWWKRYPETAQRYWWQRMQGWGKAPAELSGEDVEKILSQHLHSPSLLCIIALQDWLGMDECLRNPRVEEEQVNQPANPRHYWRYRMHITLESLLKAQVFNGRIRKILEQSERTFSECRAR